MKKISELVELVEYLNKVKEVHGDLLVNIRYNSFINGNLRIIKNDIKSVKVELNPYRTGNNNGFEIVIE